MTWLRATLRRWLGVPDASRSVERYAARPGLKAKGFGHLDPTPRCAVCNMAICGHTDAEFSGIFRDHEASATRDVMPAQAAENGCADMGRA